MSEMMAFFTAMLQAVAWFLMAKPVFYLLGLVYLIVIVKIIRRIVSF